MALFNLLSCSAFVALVLIGEAVLPSQAQDPTQLSLSYYSKTCPTAPDIVRSEMDCAVKTNPRNAAFMIRLHFHDCFVQVSAWLDEMETC